MVSIAGGPWRAMKSSHTLDGLRPEKFKMDFLIGHSRLFSLQYGKGNFTVNSRVECRTLAALSKGFFDTNYHVPALRGFNSCKSVKSVSFFLVRFPLRRVL